MEVFWFMSIDEELAVLYNIREYVNMKIRFLEKKKSFMMASGVSE